MTEAQHIEFKASWRDDYLRWVCGFANATMLVVGRNDSGAVVGLEDAQQLLEELPNMVRDSLGIMVDVNLRTEAGPRKSPIQSPKRVIPGDKADNSRFKLDKYLLKLCEKRREAGETIKRSSSGRELMSQLNHLPVRHEEWRY